MTEYVFPYSAPVDYIYACGPADCLDLLRGYAELRSVPKLRCSTDTAPLPEALAGLKPPDGVFLCLHDPAGLELARNIRRTSVPGGTAAAARHLCHD